MRRGYLGVTGHGPGLYPEGARHGRARSDGRSASSPRSIRTLRPRSRASSLTTSIVAIDGWNVESFVDASQPHRPDPADDRGQPERLPQRPGAGACTRSSASSPIGRLIRARPTQPRGRLKPELAARGGDVVALPLAHRRLHARAPQRRGESVDVSIRRPPERHLRDLVERDEVRRRLDAAEQRGRARARGTGEALTPSSSTYSNVTSRPFRARYSCAASTIAATGIAAGNGTMRARSASFGAWRLNASVYWRRLLHELVEALLHPDGRHRDVPRPEVRAFGRVQDRQRLEQALARSASARPCPSRPRS